MFTESHRTISLYVDRTTQQWVVRDANGEFWTVPSTEDAWDHRQPFQLSEETTLEPVPGHYKYLLSLPM